MGSYLEIIDPITGKRKRRNLVPTQNDIQRNIQRVAPNPTREQTLAFDSRPHQMGEPRVQGYNGVNQGAMGFLASIANKNKKVISNLLNEIKTQKQYKMPEFTTNNALSSDWFNTALKRIQVRNQMKMDMAKKKATVDALTSLLGNDSANIRSGISYLNNLLSNKTELQRAKMINQSKKDELKEQKRWHDIMGDYYDSLAKAALQKKEPKVDPYKAEKNYLERLKVFAKNPNSLIPYWDNISDVDKAKVRDYFLQTGKIPTISYQEGGLFQDDKYEILYPEQQVSSSAAKSSSNFTLDGLNVKNSKATSDGKQYVMLNDGKWYEVDLTK